MKATRAHTFVDLSNAAIKNPMGSVVFYGEREIICPELC